jgi:hypothetical protein
MRSVLTTIRSCRKGRGVGLRRRSVPEAHAVDQYGGILIALAANSYLNQASGTGELLDADAG